MVNERIDYFREISNIVSIKTDNGDSLLTNEYKKINFNDKENVLYNYINREKLDDIKKKDVVIFPFGANKSQYDAVNIALNNKISVIQGPPGTGKTQTILNIIANIIMNGMTVAIVSNNNSAIDNVYEKLEKYGYGFLCARLGRNELKEKFITHQKLEYPKFEKKDYDILNMQRRVKDLNRNINMIYIYQNEIAKYINLKEELKVEKKYFEMQNTYNINTISTIKNINKITSKDILRLKCYCEELKENQFLKLIYIKLKIYIKYKLYFKGMYKCNIKTLVTFFNKMYFDIKEHELSTIIRDTSLKIKKIGSYKPNQVILESNNILNIVLKNKYLNKTKRHIFSKSDFIRKPVQLTQEYPIILTTTYSIKNCLAGWYKFDYVIMDEASQVDIITGILSMSVAKNMVIVGDTKQLPNVITANEKNEIEKINIKYKIPDSYNYLKHSFLESILKTLPEIPNTLLKEHYRCHPKIINFCNKKFYNNQLVIMTEDKGENDVLGVYITNTGNHARGHVNQRQIDVISNEVIPELEKVESLDNIGIISPYKDQCTAIAQKINNNYQIDTVHKFQGRELDAIILTTVDNKIGKFVDDEKMLNVAITRAKRYLRLVISDNEKNESTNIYDLVKYIQYNNFKVINSKTKSIYDLLYKANREERLRYLKGKKKISEYDSENITYNKIIEIIKKNNFNNLDILTHIPLIDVLKDTSLLDEEEKKYVNNIWTHIDIVIFNKMDKMINLAIEVDGYFFHKEGTKQQERDKIKERILNKYDVPLLRLSTIESNEEATIYNALKSIFNK